MPQELSDAEVFAPTEQSDAEVFGSKELSDTDVGLNRSFDAHHAELRPGKPESTLSKIGGAFREKLANLIGPSPEMIQRDSVPNTDEHGNTVLAYKPQGSAIDQEGFFPAAGHPFVKIPRVIADNSVMMEQNIPGLPPIQRPNAEIAAMMNTASGFGEFLESPLGVATGGAGSLGSATLNRIMAAGFTADMARHVPEAARHAGEVSVTGTPQEQMEANLGLAANVVLPALTGAHALKPTPLQTSKPPAGPQTFSEFGGEVRTPAPEAPDTIAAQVAATKDPNTPKAVTLVTPGAAVPSDHGLVAVETSQGTALVNPDKVDPATAKAQLDAGGGGKLMGFSTDTKPPGDAVLQTKNADGTPVQEEVVNDASLPGAIKASVDLDPGATMDLKPAEQVLGERASAIVDQTVRDKMTAREPLPASLVDQANTGREVPLALPEGYKLEGDQYTYTEPVKPETDAARMAREQREAMTALRQTTGLDLQPVEATAAPALTERPAAGVPIEDFGERPPDILDWITDNFRSGVKLAGKADFGEYVATAKGRARELLSLTKGEAADRVLKEMHGQGFYPRIETADQLADAIVKAGDARIGERQQAAKAKKVKPSEEEVDPWQATIDKLNSLKIGTSGKLHAFGLLPAAWDTLIDLVNLGLKGGQKLAAAIDHAFAAFKAQTGTAFDEAGAREHLLESMKERATGIKVADSPAVSPEVKAAVTQYLYEARSNATDSQIADGLLQKLGPDQALELWRNPTADLPGAVRSKLLGAITRDLAEQERQLRTTDPAGAQALAEKQAALWDEALPQITDMAQSLQALNDVVSMTPEGQVAKVKRDLNTAADEEINKHGAELEQVNQAIDQGRTAGGGAVRQDPEVNASARAAVDEAITNSPETQNAVVMELAAEWAESPAILAHARETVRAKADELLNKGPRPAGFTPAQHLRQILDDLAKRSAEIFSSHIQGADGGVPIVQKLMDRLGLDREHAGKLATSLSREWESQLNIAKKKLDKRIAAQRVRQAKREAEAQTDPLVDQAIRKQLRETNQKLGDVLRQEAGRRGETGEHVADRVVKASGLTGEKADALRATLKRRWNELVAEGQRKALDTIAQRTGVKLTRPMRSVFDKAVELDRLGGLETDATRELTRKALKLKQLTQDDAAELRRLVRLAQSKPEGFMRQRAAADVLQFTEKLKGQVSWRDVPMAIFYANILSGFTTPAKIVFENTNLLIGNTLAEFLGHPVTNTLHPIEFGKLMAQAYGRGLAKGAMQAEGTLRTGKVTGVWNEARTNVLENKPFGARLEPLNIWKYFTRAISTAHETTFKPAWEVKQTMIARDVARREGLAGDQLQRRAADLMANTPAAIAEAKAQALKEFAGSEYNKMDYRRRVTEILEQRRETNMPGSTETARDFALRTAYLNEPYGFMGLLATGIRSILERARKEFPVLGTAAKTQIPFTTVVANILNEKLNWTPVGLLRAGISEKTGNLYGRAILDPAERSQLYTKAILGTVAVSALATLFGDHIHGNGPASPQKRKQLQATGWIPHSFEWNGKYYSYMNTPAALGLAVVGNWLDWHRYGHGDDADGVTRGAFAAKATANAIVSQGMLDSVRRLFDAVGSESTSEGGDKIQKLMARTASAAVVPSLVQQVDRLFDPTVYDQSGMKALLTSQIPFVRRQNKPALNVLGEPVQSGPFHYWASKQTEDPVWRMIAEKQAFVPEPSKSTIIGNKKLGPDYSRAITPDEYYQLIAESGPQIRAELEKNLDTLKTLPPDQAQALVTKIANVYHTAAKAKLQ